MANKYEGGNGVLEEYSLVATISMLPFSNSGLLERSCRKPLASKGLKYSSGT